MKQHKILGSDRLCLIVKHVALCVLMYTINPNRYISQLIYNPGDLGLVGIVNKPWLSECLILSVF